MKDIFNAHAEAKERLEKLLKEQNEMCARMKELQKPSFAKRFLGLGGKNDTAKEIADIEKRLIDNQERMKLETKEFEVIQWKAADAAKRAAEAKIDAEMREAVFGAAHTRNDVVLMRPLKLKMRPGNIAA